VERQIRRPLVTASIGETAMKTGSGTSAASSTITRETLEKPRIVSGSPGTAMMRLPLQNSRENVSSRVASTGRSSRL
jgi:hypothetical protein